MNQFGHHRQACIPNTLFTHSDQFMMLGQAHWGATRHIGNTMQTVHSQASHSKQIHAQKYRMAGVRISSATSCVAARDKTP